MTPVPVFSKKKLEELPVEGEITDYASLRKAVVANADEFSKFPVYPTIPASRYITASTTNSIGGTTAPTSLGQTARAKSIFGPHCLLARRLVEAIVIPEDYAFNIGDTSKIARGVAVNNNSIELIYALNSVDSINWVAAYDWRQLSKKPYYTGIELSKSWGDEPARVIATLPVDATTYQDMEVYPQADFYLLHSSTLFRVSRPQARCLRTCHAVLL